MAIFPRYPGLEAQVIVDGRPLQEFEDESDQPAPHSKDVVKFVESKAGSVFSVRLIVTEAFETKIPGEVIVCYLYVDGQQVNGKILSPSNPMGEITGNQYKEGKLYRLALFQFSDIELSEEASGDLKTADLKDLGTIRVSFRRAIKLPGEDNSVRDWKPAQAVKSLPEKKLKGSDSLQQVAFKPGEEIQPLKYARLQYPSPHGDADFAYCTFKYRSRASLQSLLLIPRSPTPPPIGERLQHMTREELVRHVQELEQRHKQGRDDAVNLKQEGAKQEGSVGIKRGRSTGASGSGVDEDDDDEVVMLPPKKKVIETIDLSED